MAIKRRFKKKTRGSSRWQTYSRAGSQLWKDVKMLKGLVNTEFKSYETTNSGAPDVNGLAYALFTPVQGDGISQISGQSSRLKSIQFYMTFIKHASATQTRIRWALVLDKEGSRALTSALIWDDPYSAFRNLDERKDIVILKEGKSILDVDDTEKQYNIYKKLDMKVIMNSSNSGTYTSVKANNLWLFVWSDDNTYEPTFAYRSRARFIDN